MKFVYDEIRVVGDCISRDFRFGDYKEYSLMGILNKIGEDGWELVGEVQSRLIVKKRIEE